MKKIKKLVVLILFFVLSITIVNAQSDIFEYAWNKKVIENENFEYVLMTTKEPFQNGYFISSMNEMNYYDYKGNLITHKDLTNSAVLAAVELKDYLYAFMIDGETSEFKLIKMDNNLNIVSESLIDNESGNMFITLYLSAVKYAGYNLLSVVNDEITIVGMEENDIALLHYDKDLKFKSKDVLTRDDYEVASEYYPFIGEFIAEYGEMEEAPEILTILSDQNGTKKVYNGANLSQCKAPVLNLESAPAEYAPCYISSVLKLTDSEKVLFEKNYEDYTAIINAKVIGNYIVALAINDLGDITKLEAQSELELLSQLESEILIINMQGEIVQTIKSDNYKYVSINPSPAGFITNKFNMDCSSSSDCLISMEADTYNLHREVTTKVIGKGNISVASTSIAGESVTYVVTPEKGYVLGKVIITDENGNIIETTENTFTMPSAAVTIEVSFLPENPETRDIAVMLFIAVLLLGSILTLVNYRKLKDLR